MHSSKPGEVNGYAERFFGQSQQWPGLAGSTEPAGAMRTAVEIGNGPYPSDRYVIGNGQAELNKARRLSARCGIVTPR